MYRIDQSVVSRSGQGDRGADLPHPVRIAGIVIDRLSATLTLLVASVGAVTFRFSLRYLDGEPRQRSFLYCLSFTVVAAYVLERFPREVPYECIDIRTSRTIRGYLDR